MIISMPPETISKELFILENYPYEVRAKLTKNTIEDCLWDVQELARIAIEYGCIDKVIEYTKLQNYFKDLLKSM